MYLKLFVTFAYYANNALYYSNRVYSLDSPRIKTSTIKNAEKEFYKEMRYHFGYRGELSDIVAIFWKRINSEIDAADNNPKESVI
jgi:hypothetical protein